MRWTILGVLLGSLVTLIIDQINDVIKRAVEKAVLEVGGTQTAPLGNPTPEVKTVPRVANAPCGPVEGTPQEVPRTVGMESEEEEEEDSSYEEEGATSKRQPEINAMKNDIEEMKKMNKRAHGQIRSGGSPFVQKIFPDPLPKNFKPLTYEYDNTFDLYDHLLRFENRASLHQYTEGVKCRVFLTTLTNAAQKRFSQLPPNVVRSFK
ncbi:hypothetical protein ACS0TY_018010 [Phlomoides rotata]